MTLELHAHDLAHGGEAIGRADGKAVFVAGVIPGEVAKVEIVKDGGAWARARLVEISSPSPDRVEPHCPHFAECGGCQWQYLDYSAQLEWKARTVAGQLAHLGGLAEVEVRSTVPAASPYRYRNRMDFHVSNGRPALYRSRSRQLVALEECHLLTEPLAELFARLGPLGEATHITLRSSDATGEVLVVVRGGLPPGHADWGVNVARVQRGRPVSVVGRTWITERVRGHDYRITANAFFQNNTDGAGHLVDLVAEALEPEAGEVLLDGYAGGGLFSVAMSDRVDEVIAVETSPLGLADLEHNLESVGAFAAIVPAPFEEVASEVDEWDIAVVDPPRTGLGADGAAAVVAGSPRAIALVSCDPAALARDAKAIVESGYELAWVAPVDLFPQTFHIEAVAKFVAA